MHRSDRGCCHHLVDLRMLTTFSVYLTFPYTLHFQGAHHSCQTSFKTYLQMITMLTVRE